MSTSLVGKRRLTPGCTRTCPEIAGEAFVRPQIGRAAGSALSVQEGILPALLDTFEMDGVVVFPVWLRSSDSWSLSLSLGRL